MYVLACMCRSFFFFKQKTAYEMRISDWSSDVCSSDLEHRRHGEGRGGVAARLEPQHRGRVVEVEQGLGRAPEEDAGRNRGAERHREPAPARENGRRKIGRASCRERVCQYV